MEVKVFSIDENDIEEGEYNSYIRIKFNNELVFSISEGRPEENLLHKNFNDCYKIPSLLRLAYEAGLKGEQFTLIKK